MKYISRGFIHHVIYFESNRDNLEHHILDLFDKIKQRI